MSSTLLVYLPANTDDEICWLQRNANGDVVERGTLPTAAALGDLAPRSHRLDTYVLVPSEQCSVHAVAALGNSSAARRALKFQIEEQLCAPPEDLHIALAGAVADNQQRLIAIDLEQFAAWHAQLENADVRVTAMLPDALALPQNHALSDGERRLIHAGGHAAMIDEANFEAWCGIAGLNPSEIHCQPVPEGDAQIWLESIAAQFSAAPGCNLLAGEFALRSQWQRTLSRWRWPLVAGIAVLSLSWLSMWLENRQLESEVDAYAFQLESIYRDVFPEQRRVPRPRRQMEEYLASMGDQVDRPPMLPWLQILTTQAAAVAGTRIQELTFQREPDRLSVTLTVPDYQQLDALSNGIAGTGLDVKRGTVSRKGQSVTAELDITGGNL